MPITAFASRLCASGTRFHSQVRVIIGAGCLLVGVAASAQTRVKVIQDQTVIWDPGFTIVITTVQAGTELEVVGQRGTWYEVVLPIRSVSGQTTGFVA